MGLGGGEGERESEEEAKRKRDGSGVLGGGRRGGDVERKVGIEGRR